LPLLKFQPSYFILSDSVFTCHLTNLISLTDAVVTSRNRFVYIGFTALNISYKG